ncbi:hypothetical protein BOTBODRAFT_229251 [Botryobasidium botryosum FD-172 SS1]|uniref:Uncharacterized protein n=1 Tax=Botryobasidium botryosum (strain FD-172 SS1) TaxID=930990 RepID=A0A067LV47_BOTB1|nr:hypothetical protein BOTBODRAFT_229251 [Botryobasidium botryosum FD-172 SS1]
MVAFDYNVFSATSQAEMNGRSSAVVWLGIGTKNPSDLMNAYAPVTLLNNLHLRASYTNNIRRTFSNSVQSFLGIFQVS